MEEHPVQQPICGIDVSDTPAEGLLSFMVGRAGVTRIEACQKSGMYANIPYIRVWKGDVCAAEFCQHNIIGVFFDPPVEAEVAR